MQSTYRGKVTAVTRGQGTFQREGSPEPLAYSFTKVFVELNLKGKDARGLVSQEYKIGDYDFFDKCGFANINLPFLAEFVTQKTANGRGDVSEEIISFEILQPPVPQSKAA